MKCIDPDHPSSPPYHRCSGKLIQMKLKCIFNDANQNGNILRAVDVTDPQIPQQEEGI